MIAKEHKTPDGKTILAVYDSELKRKRIEEKNLQIDLESDFYDGTQKSEEEIKKMMSSAYIINVVGENSVSLALSMNLISKDNIICIDNIKHAQAIIEKN